MTSSLNKPGPKKKFDGDVARVAILLPTSTHQKLVDLSLKEQRTVSAQIVYLVMDALDET